MLSKPFLEFVNKKQHIKINPTQSLESQDINWEKICLELSQDLQLEVFRPDPLFLATASSCLTSEIFEKIDILKWQENLSFVTHTLDNQLGICVVDPFNIEWVNFLRFITSKEIEIKIVSYPDLLLIYRSLDPSFKLDNEELVEDAFSSTRKRERNSEAVTVKFLDQLISDAFLKGATDIHFIPTDNLTKIKFRLDGDLIDRIQIPNKLAKSISYRLKSLANLDVANSISPQDGSMRYDDGFKTHELRLSFIPCDQGESIVIRILGATVSNAKLDSLGLSEIEIETIRSCLVKSQGLIVVSGPTGAGKTTTLYSFLRELNDGKRKIITIEDPVEYRIEGISQFQVNEKQGLSFCNLLRSALRHDPDVILVGELRDSETAKICVQAAQTGHLVLTTTHANSCAGAITRLTNLGIPRADLSSVLSLVVHQRLVKIKSGGRKALFSVLKITRELAQSICSGAGELEIEELAQANGYVNLYAKALYLKQEEEIEDEELRKIEDNSKRYQSPNKPLILLVEDNQETALVFKRILEDRFLRVELANDGIEALEKLTEITPDLIISDIMMPRMSGIELVKKIRNQLGLVRIPIVMLTAVDTDENELKSFELGASEFVSKMDDPQIIVARVERLLKQ